MSEKGNQAELMSNLDLNATQTKKAINNKRFNDGVQVSVNSDEKLDCEDDVLLGEDHDNGSINEMQNDESQKGKDSCEVVRDRVQNEDDSTNSDIILGTTSVNMSDEELVMSNPHLKKLFSKMLDERIKQTNKNRESSSSRLLSTLSLQVATAKKGNVEEKVGQGNPLIKSPSDTMIYTPALNRTPVIDNMGNTDKILIYSQNHAGGQRKSDLGIMPTENNKDKEDFLKHIADFVDQLKLESESGENVNLEFGPSKPRSMVRVSGLEEAQPKAEHAVLEVEKFCAAVETPQGRNSVILILRMIPEKSGRVHRNTSWGRC